MRPDWKGLILLAMLAALLGWLVMGVMQLDLRRGDLYVIGVAEAAMERGLVNGRGACV